MSNSFTRKARILFNIKHVRIDHEKQYDDIRTDLCSNYGQLVHIFMEHNKFKKPETCLLSFFSFSFHFIVSVSLLTFCHLMECELPLG